MLIFAQNHLDPKGDQNKSVMKQQIDAAIKVLKEGGVILYPTDIIWGLVVTPQTQRQLRKSSR